jgi:hypothetical protein
MEQLELQPRVFKQWKLFSEVFAIEKKQDPLDVRVVLGKESDKSIADRMRVVDQATVRLPSLLAPGQLRFA